MKTIFVLVFFSFVSSIRPSFKPTLGNNNAPCPNPCRDYQVCDTIDGICRCSDSLAMNLYHKVCLTFLPNSLLVQCRQDSVQYCNSYQICNSDNKCQCNDSKCTSLLNYVCSQQKPLGTCVPCRSDNLSQCSQSFHICSIDNQCICNDQKCLDNKMICNQETTVGICVQCRNNDFLFNCDLGSQVCNDLNGKCQCSSALCQNDNFRVCALTNNDPQPLCICSDQKCQQNFKGTFCNSLSPQGICVQCRNNQHCSSIKGQICNEFNVCVCQDQECQKDSLIDGLNKQKFCKQFNSTNTICVQCRDNKQCLEYQTCFKNYCICKDQLCKLVNSDNINQVCTIENGDGICKQCRQNYNCRQYQICVENICQPVQCLQNNDCNELYQKCQAYTCVCDNSICNPPGKNNGKQCTTEDKDGLCVCKDDICGQDNNILSRFCTSLDELGECVQCRGDTNCSYYGEVCDLSIHRCVCKDSQCKIDFGPRHVCKIEGSSEAVTQCVFCRQNSDCPTDYQVCEDYQCKCKDQLCFTLYSEKFCDQQTSNGQCKTCRQDFQCGSKQICKINQCVSVQCKENNDCDTNYQFCQNFQCICSNSICNPDGENNGRQCTTQDKDGICLCKDDICGQNTNTSKICTSLDEFGKCVQCRSDSNCTYPGEVCDQSINICVCQDSQCKNDFGSAYLCKIQGSPEAPTQCVLCRQNSDCPKDYHICENYQCKCKDQLCFTLYSGKYCNSETSNGQCKTCRSDFQCGPKQVCQGNQCLSVQCKQDNDCNINYQICKNITGNLLCVCSNSICNPFKTNGKQCTINESAEGQCVCRDSLCGTQVCNYPDKAQGICVQCRNNTSCQLKGGQICDIASNKCVCDDTQCSKDYSILKVCKILNSTNAQCVQCRDNNHCLNFQSCQNYQCKCKDQRCFAINGTYCDKEQTGGVCKMCRQNFQCQKGYYCINNQCVLGGCATNSDCDQTYQICSGNKCICNNALCSSTLGRNCTSQTQNGICICYDSICPGTFVCTTRDTKGVCVQCNKNNDCAVAGEICDTSCHLCTCDDNQCSSDYGYNNPSNILKKCKYPNSTNTICVQCRQQIDCKPYQLCLNNSCLCDDSRCSTNTPTKPFCDLQKNANGVCVQCRNNNQCSGNQVCTSNNLCMQCGTDFDCPFRKSCINNICICNNSICNPGNSQGLICTSQDAAGQCVCKNSQCVLESSLFVMKRPFCLSQNTTEQKCVQCFNNGHCLQQGQVCDSITNICVCTDQQCLSDAGINNQYCKNLGSSINTVCERCRQTSHCQPFQICQNYDCSCKDQRCTSYYSTAPNINLKKLYCSQESTVGICVQCRNDQQCPGTSYCQNFNCKTCLSNSDCTICNVGQLCLCIDGGCVKAMNIISSSNFVSSSYYSLSSNVIQRVTSSSPDRNLYIQSPIQKSGVSYLEVQIKTRASPPNNIFNFGVVNANIKSMSQPYNIYGQIGGIVYQAFSPTNIQSQNDIQYSNLPTVVLTNKIRIVANWNTKRIIFYQNNNLVREVDMLSNWLTNNIYFVITIAQLGDQLLIIH